MNFLEICGIIFLVELTVCILVLIFAMKNAEDDNHIYEAELQRRELNLKTFLEGEAEATNEGDIL